jgi:magnesium-protoporphyrin O-methyltransferase
MDCCQRPLDRVFDDRTARGDLRRFRKKGADKPTAVLIDAVANRSLPPAPSLIDVGGGIGAIHHLLLDRGFATATHVDFSNPYLETAESEAVRRGHRDRVQFRYGAFAEIAPTLEMADVVTLDRVVCCDPDYNRLLHAAAGRARRVVAFSYPRERWVIRVMMVFGNLMQRVRGRAFRTFLHSAEAMAAVLERAGLTSVWTGGTWVWKVDVFERAAQDF